MRTSFTAEYTATCAIEVGTVLSAVASARFEKCFQCKIHAMKIDIEAEKINTIQHLHMSTKKSHRKVYSTYAGKQGV